MMKKRGIKDVANKAGVSIATVSFVLHKRPRLVINEKATRRVLDAANEIGCHPHAAAAGLVRKRTRNVAIIGYQEAQLISNHFYSFVVEGASRAGTSRVDRSACSDHRTLLLVHGDLPSASMITLASSGVARVPVWVAAGAPRD